MGESEEKAAKSWEGITNDMDADGNKFVEKSEWIEFYVKTLKDAPLDAVTAKLGEMKEKMAAGTTAKEIAPDPAVAAVVADAAEGVPEATVKDGMKFFQDKYNADETAECGACYTDECHVTVNGGEEKGGFGPFKTPAEVAGFLDTLRNKLGGTNMEFTV